MRLCKLHPRAGSGVAIMVFDVERFVYARERRDTTAKTEIHFSDGTATIVNTTLANVLTAIEDALNEDQSTTPAEPPRRRPARRASTEFPVKSKYA